MNHQERIRSKFFSREAIVHQAHIWRFKGKKIVFTNGCFDILHLGHIDYLVQAADLGHELIIGLNSDPSVQRLKGPGRPVNPQDARATLLASLSMVSAVVLFDEDTPYELIRLIRPDILVKGADYSVEQIAGHELVLSGGGEVITIPLTPGFSTTSLMSRMASPPSGSSF